MELSEWTVDIAFKCGFHSF